MKLGFTGTRQGMTPGQYDSFDFLVEELEGDPISEFHHGDCLGADEQAHGIIQGKGIRTVVHPPANDRLRAFCEGDEVREPSPYLTRNLSIVTECDWLFAAPAGKETLRSGTWSTARKAKAKGKPVTIITPLGNSYRY